MKNIAIIGAGQSGLMLAIGLLKHKYKVTLVSDKTANEIYNGYIMSSQGQFHASLTHERALQINEWDNISPKNRVVNFNILDYKTQHTLVSWRGFTKNHFQSIDQRIKFYKWLNQFVDLGGSLTIKKADLKLINELSLNHDLVIISTGKGNVSNAFTINEEKTEFSNPMRKLALVYLKNTLPRDVAGVSINIIPSMGECFVMSGLTKNGPCEMLLIEGIASTPFDCWNDVSSSEEQFKLMLSLLDKYIPYEAQRYLNSQLTDKKACLRGEYRPVVKDPIIKLPSGNYALGMADTIVLNDPIAGQGANNASHCAMIYLDSILQQQDKGKLDKDWMLNAFDRFWENAKWSTKLSNMLLKSPSPQLQLLLSKASKSQHLSNLFANAFDQPKILFPILDSLDKTKTFISQHFEMEETVL